MKLSEFKSDILQRLDIFRASSLFAFRKEIAYSGNNWARIISTTAYTLSMLLFVNIIFANTKEIAGYTHNEMLLYFFMGQLTYYTNWSFSMINLYELISDVNRGNLDMVLMKPVPALFYLTTRNLGGFNMVADGLPPTLAIIFAINWPDLGLNPTNVIYGIFIFIFGSIALHVFQFLSALPVFWLGESENIVDLAGFIGAGSGSMIPFEGFARPFQIVFGTVVPVLIATAFSSSAILGKTNAQFLFFWAFIIALLAVIIRNFAWKLAIKNYTSAQS
jgi:ABC-2 type transport system permease protein